MYANGIRYACRELMPYALCIFMETVCLCRLSVFIFPLSHISSVPCANDGLLANNSLEASSTGDLYAHRLTLRGTCIKHKRVHHKSNIRYLISCSLQNALCFFRLPFVFFFFVLRRVCRCHQQTNTTQSRHWRDSGMKR